jgi:rhodanese-related sulfurtransferase/rubrerythrin
MAFMKWKQFLTPVHSFSARDAKSFMEKMPGDAYTLLDVRQPEEYGNRHIPGAKLIPIADIGARIDELDGRKPTIVYCAIGGRSRVAAQMLAGKGFREVYNLSGGIKAWDSKTAFGAEDLGMDLFDGSESPEESLLVAYSLEEGLREFYLTMLDRVKDEDARQLFRKLSEIEVKHQDRIFNQYLDISGSSVSREAFATKTVAPAMEGGLSTEDFLAQYPLDLEVTSEIVSMAMAIEAQALDLYQRASGNAADEKSKAVLLQIADEERAHLSQLGTLFKSEGK